jgi:aspartate kinase
MLSVIKIGGSVLRDAASFDAVAGFISRRLSADRNERLIVIVSAEFGATDALLDEARSIVAEPSADALDLLWSTGELRSVARLSLHLQRVGVQAAPLNVHQTGLTWADGRATVRPMLILAALAHTRVAIVPGFLAVHAGGGIRSLGRGGSDLTAVLVAIGLRARQCELVKDVAGYYSSDPHEHADATPIRDLTITQALDMAATGCHLVQLAALEAAGAASLPLVVRCLSVDSQVTYVHPHATLPADVAACQ